MKKDFVAHLSIHPNIKENDKIPPYASQFRKEWLYIRGINKELYYIVDNIFKSKEGLFQNSRVARIKKFIKRFLLAQERGRLQDISNFTFERRDVLNIIEVSKEFKNFCQYIEYYKYCCDDGDDSYVDCYPGFDDINNIFNLFISKFKIKSYESYYRIYDSDSDSDSDSDRSNYCIYDSDSDSED